MSSSPPPISKLPHDVLWRIFSFNSHPILCSFEHDARYILGIPSYGGSPPEPALITTRRTSQVCSDWRKVLLAPHGSVIWANGLDLQHLNQQGDQWREEVLRRTGAAPLTVVGNIGKLSLFTGVCPQNSFAVPFLFKLLDIHWERMRTFVIFSVGFDVDRKIRGILDHPAPFLKNFIIKLHMQGAAGKILPFSNHAPSLSSFDNHKHGTCLSETSWARKIGYLKLRWSGTKVAVPELLQGLEQMPLLETLILDFWGSYGHDASTEPIAHISLPQLRHFTLTYPEPGLLPYISTPPQCAIVIQCGFMDEQYSEYSAFVQTHFPAWNITHISYTVEFSVGLDHEYHPFHHIVMKDAYGDVTETRPHFDFCGFTWEMPVALDMARALSSTSCRPSLHRVTSFQLKLDPKALLNYPSLDDMSALLHNLRSVETFHTDDKTLRLSLVAGQPQPDADAEAAPHPHLMLVGCSSWFPNLRTIVVDRWDLGIEAFLRPRLHADEDMLGGERTRISVLLEEGSGSSLRVGDPAVLEKASRFGVAVGWEVAGAGNEVIGVPPNDITRISQ